MSMKTLIRKPAMAVGISAAIALTGAHPQLAGANAAQAPAAPAQTGCQAKATAGSTDMTLMTGAQRARWVAAADKAVRDGSVDVQAGQEHLAMDGTKVYSVKSAEGTFTSVTIPVREGYSFLSNVTVLFDTRGHVVKHSETQYTKNQAGNFRITTYVNGDLVKNQDTDIAFMSDSALKATGGVLSAHGAQSDSVQQDTVGCVMAVLGVSGAVAYLIVGACTGACATPGVGTAVCVACIGAYATVGGASVTAIASCFQ